MDQSLPRFQRRWLAVDCSEDLPADILELSRMNGDERVWLARDLPRVVAATRDANLLNLGGDLQVITPAGPYCEPIGAYIDTERVSGDLPWDIQVAQAAHAALEDFEAMREHLAEIARLSFPSAVAEAEQAGRHPSELLYFRWLVANEAEGRRLQTEEFAKRS